MQLREHTEGKSALSAALDLLKVNWSVVLAVIIGSTGWAVFTEQFYSDEGSVAEAGLFVIDALIETLMWAVLAYAAYGTLFTGGPGLAALRIGRFLSFYWRDTLLFIVPVISAIMVLFAGFVIAAVLYPDVGETLLDARLIVLAALLLAIVLRAYVGTWVPAVVVGGDRTLRTALARGKRTFRSTLVQLLFSAGPVAVLMAAFILLSGDGFFTDDGQLTWMPVTCYLIAAVFEALLAATIAVVVSRAYLQVESGNTVDSS